MDDPKYILQEKPTYETEIRALKDDDPAKASTVFNPLFTIILNNIHAIKLEVDNLKKNSASLISPALTGTPTAPTAEAGTNNGQIANTEFVQVELAVLEAKIDELSGGGTDPGGEPSGETTQAVLGSSFLGLAYLDGSTAYVPVPLAAFLRTESGELVRGAVRLENGEIAELVILPVNNG